MGRPIFFILVLTATPLTVSCEGHLPPLETAPGNGPTISDIVTHINCEIASVVNAQVAKDGTVTNTNNSTLLGRIKFDPKLAARLHYLVDEHFVAAAQLTLDVTDTEGVSPSMNFVTPYNSAMGNNRTLGIGANLNGTQDRTLSVGYSIDLDKLTDTSKQSYYAQHCLVPGADGVSVDILAQDNTSGYGIAGDLGLADVIAEGLTGLDATKDANLYGGAGPVSPVFTRHIKQTGSITATVAGTGSASYGAALTGKLIATPPAAGAGTPTTLSFSGNLDVTDDTGKDAQGKPLVTRYKLTGWTGQYDDLDSKRNIQRFHLSGTMTTADPESKITENLGTSPTVNVMGRSDASLDEKYFYIDGTGTSSGGKSFTVKIPDVPVLPVAKAIEDKLLAGTGLGSAPQGAKSASAQPGGTSFGGIIDFVIGYGLNGGPTWSLSRFKGPGSGSNPLFSASRTNTDTLTITFVASCQVTPSAIPANYWQSIGQCNDQSKQDSGSEAKSISTQMILQKFFAQ